jgi:hypothetical protein
MAADRQGGQCAVSEISRVFRDIREIIRGIVYIRCGSIVRIGAVRRMGGHMCIMDMSHDQRGGRAGHHPGALGKGWARMAVGKISGQGLAGGFLRCEAAFLL